MEYWDDTYGEVNYGTFGSYSRGINYIPKYIMYSIE